MTWQDIVLSIGSWIFIIAIIPIFLSKAKPPLSTSLPTGIVLLIFAFVYTTLGLWLSMASTGLLGLAWLAIAWQKMTVKSQKI